MEAIGLMPSNTGTPGGKTTGEKMSHYIMADGPFIHACKELLQTSFVIVWYDRFPVQMVREYEFAADTTVTVAQPAASTAEATRAGEMEVIGPTLAQAAGAAAVVPLYSAPPIDGGLDVERPQSGGSGGAVTKKADGSNRTKYVCGCKNNIWGKPGLRLRCEACDTRFAAAV
ncbi:zinc metalloproteinase Mpr protein [Noviherbaspirillum soli]|uniref:zinc metalloproteinase Mpr protein n=1 Tax=Noviherbaspirillum soli TaxID=1064518 RepID=UPI001E4D7894|nr:zinc metalloproteinase Mpr protein [Noviherbaspirillum soli]